MKCSVPCCGRPVLRRGLCPMHYQRVKRHGEPQGAQPSRQRNNRVIFTPELWRKWFASRQPDEHAVKLRTGIQQMRKALERE